MRASVVKAWPVYCQRWEGVTYWMYLDTKNKVTTGTGNLIDTVADAQKLEWVTKSGAVATKAEVEAEWKRVKALTNLSKYNGLNAVWSKPAVLLLTRPTVDALLLQVTATFWTQLKKTLPQLETFPADAQLAIMDEAWQNGKYFLDPGTVWVGTRAAVLAQDWAAAATHVPGTGDRANFRKRLFNNAAKVKKLGLDPEILWDTKTPVAPPVVTPPVVVVPPVVKPPVVVVPPVVKPPVTPAPTSPSPPKENILHSSKWGTDYVRWRGGYFPPITVEKLSAIPSYIGVVQGGLSFAGPSALTHAGLGVGDGSVRGMSKAEVWDLCTQMWKVDIAPCPRGFVADSFQGRTISDINDGNEHIHFLDLDCVRFMHPQAQAQVKEILAGGDGLRGNAHYTGPSKSHRISYSKSPYNPKIIAAAKKKKELELPTTEEVTKDVLGRDGLIENVFTGNPDNKEVSLGTAIVYLGKRSQVAEERQKRIEADLADTKKLLAETNQALAALVSRLPDVPAA